MALATCELEYQVMALEMMNQQLRELNFGEYGAQLICYNKAILHIALSPIFYERTKHIEVNCPIHYREDSEVTGCITTRFINFNNQPTSIFTKSFKGPRISYICLKRKQEMVSPLLDYLVRKNHDTLY